MRVEVRSPVLGDRSPKHQMALLLSENHLHTRSSGSKDDSLVVNISRIIERPWVFRHSEQSYM
jgi:hypothetical protein